MGRLYVVPTPIGNLEDITARAIRVLTHVSIIFAEDTRHTRNLLNHYSIETRLASYHQHNKRTRIPEILSALEDGDVALVSDAGMPSVADPGYEVIQAVIEAGQELDVLPGANAAITAVVGAALPAPGFVFVGFLPRARGAQRALLEPLYSLPYSLVLFEAPHRLVDTLKSLLSHLDDREAVVARELTKVHQEYARGRLSELVGRYAEAGVKGECTLVVSGRREVEPPSEVSVRTYLAARHAAGEDSRTAVAGAMARFGLHRNAVYRLWVEVVHEGAPLGGPEEDDTIR